MSKIVHIGSKAIGGGNPIAIQSMTNTDTADKAATIAQIKELQNSGADIVRMTVNTTEAADAVADIVKATDIPLVADIHFNYEYAIKSIKSGIAKVRINPSNIGSQYKISEVVNCAKAYSVPIRVGVNSGSIESDILEQYGNTAKALAASALRNIIFLEKYDFYDTIISVKSSDVRKSIEAYKIINEKVDYPLHLGITEAGFGEMAIVKSSIGIGSLLAEGIGDTIRVSISGNPVQEVEAAKKILMALDMYDKPFVNIISCPTCGRTEIDVQRLAERLSKALSNCKQRLNVAVMGCIVNGLGEGKEADYGVAGGNDESIIFSKGKRLCIVPNEKIEETLLKIIEENGELS